MYVLLILYIVINVITTINCNCIQVNRTRGICTSVDDIQQEAHRRWTILDINGGDAIEKITPKILVKLQNLKKLSIKNNLNHINPNGFKRLTNLSTLILQDNNLQKINYRMFEDTNIKKVYMSNNNVYHFTMVPLDKLLEFGMEHEKLPTITEGMFNIQSVEKLSLRKNQIETIENNTFNGMDNLKYLYLCGNNIRDFNSEEIFGNTILEHLYMNENLVEVLSPEMFMGLPNLKTLYLGRNQIESIDYKILQSLPNLEELSLAYNKISAIEPSELPLKLRVINLSFNLIYFFPYYQFSDLNDLKELSMIGNPLHCSCWNSLEKWMKSEKVRQISCLNNRFKNGQLPVCVKYNDSPCVRNMQEDLDSNVTETYLNTLNAYDDIPDCLYIKSHTFITNYYNITVF